MFDNNDPQVCSNISANSQVIGIQVSTLLNVLLSKTFIHFFIRNLFIRNFYEKKFRLHNFEAAVTKLHSYMYNWPRISKMSTDLCYNVYFVSYRLAKTGKVGTYTWNGWLLYVDHLHSSILLCTL